MLQHTHVMDYLVTFNFKPSHVFLQFYELIGHPTLRTYLNHKWNTMAKYTFWCVHVCMYVCVVVVVVVVVVCVCVCVFVCVHTHACMCACVYLCLCTCMHAHMHLFLYMYDICTHVYNIMHAYYYY